MRASGSDVSRAKRRVQATVLRNRAAPLLGRRIGRRPRIGHALASWYLSWPAPRASARRLVIYHESDRISMAQVYPFLHYARNIRATYDVQVCCVPIDRLLAFHPVDHRREDVVLVQAWFRRDGPTLGRAVESLAATGASVSFIDTFAHNDLRLARFLALNVDVYLKKSLFHDRSLYYRAFRGDTYIADFYKQLYGLDGEIVDWQVPDGFTDRLRLSPNFFTAPDLLTAFERAKPPDMAGREIDVHARLGLGPDNGSSYRHMREHALRSLQPLTDLEVVSEGRVDRKRYMAELRKSKLCFSPFGYGELCWRDIEAILTGAVLVKPDMSHLETLPDLYEPGVTYLPVRWDFADVADVVRAVLTDPQRRASIATEAHRRVADYLRAQCFVDEIAFLFELRHGKSLPITGRSMNDPFEHNQMQGKMTN